MKFIGLIIAVAVVAFGIYYYEHRQNGQDPLAQYQNIIKLPTSQQVAAAAVAVKGWVTDPADNLPYPKGWQRISMTLGGQTYSAVTPDTNNPPTYYVSLNFPKSQIANEHLIKCVPTTSKTTELCLVGDNPEVDAYFNIVAWIKNNPVTNTNSSNTTTQ